MLYHILAEIVQQINHSFTCPLCHQKTNPDNLSIIHISTHNASIAIECSCGNNVMIQAEISADNDNITLNQNKISQNDLQTVHNALENGTSISDFFKKLEQ